MTSIYNRFSHKVSLFQEEKLPEEAILAGYAALINVYELEVPLPLKLAAISSRHKIYESGNWKVFTPRHAPSPTLEGQLIFALKYEGLELAVLKQLFKILDPYEIEQMVHDKPTSRYTRRIWFLYEWLMGYTLDISNAEQGAYVDAVNTTQQLAIQGIRSPRHRVMNNLPGPPEFCPMVYRTPLLQRYSKANLATRAREIISGISSSLLARTSAFLMLKDSKCSFEIEGENPPENRIQRWARAIRDAGRERLDVKELLRLQKVVIGDARFVRLGLRTQGGFVGEHERDSRLPLPVHISANPEDLPSLMEGIVEFDNSYAEDLPPIVAAAILAFGFIYIHPFEDGNGRLHRYLIHHALSRRGFNPPGLIFPVSATILERVDVYRTILESYSQRLLPLIKWKPTPEMNVHVLNETADFYRYFDATPHVEFLYACVEKTIRFDLPEEVEFLKKYDHFKAHINSIVDMPASVVDLLFNFLKQSHGHLSQRALEKEFASLNKDEVERIEDLYASIWSAEQS
jgi:hypothetical protein